MQAYAEQRASLLGGADVSRLRAAFQGEQDMIAASEDVTASLRRTRQMMAQNIEQSEGKWAAAAIVGLFVRLS